MLPTPDQFNQLVRQRRSVFPKQFIAGKSVPDEIIQQIITNATWAPNHGGSEPWYFTVFAGDGRKRFADFQSELYKATAGDRFNEDKYSKLRETPLLASHIIAICMKRSEKKNIPALEDVEAVACAVQNIYLSVTAYGLGGYWTTGGVTYLQAAKAFFNLGQEDQLLGFFYIAEVAVPSPAGKRKPIEDKLIWVRG